MPKLINQWKFKSRRRDLRSDQTDAEKALWMRIRASQLFGMKFERQYAFGPYILDFFCHGKSLAIELDGSQHLSSIEYDSERTEYLNGHGIRVLRFWNNDVLKNIEGVLEVIRKEIGESGLH